MDDIRYSELVFLRALEKGNREFEFFNPSNSNQLKTVGLSQTLYLEMVILLLEELCIRFHDERHQGLVERLRGELSGRASTSFATTDWDFPRRAILSVLMAQNVQSLKITYRGLRRIQELRDTLRSDRILEPRGVLLSQQYFLRDLEDALRNPEVPVSLLHSDLDDFKSINTEFGHEAGNIVMQRYLEIVRDTLGNFGTGYRSIGDEVTSIVIGQGHTRTLEFADQIRKNIEEMDCQRNGKKIRSITVSIGVATAPPSLRNAELENLAEAAQRRAKLAGKNQVLSA